MRYLFLAALCASFLASPTILVKFDGLAGEGPRFEIDSDKTLHDLMSTFHELDPQPEGQRVFGVHNGEKITGEKMLQRISEVIAEGSEEIRISLIKAEIQKNITINLFGTMFTTPKSLGFPSDIQCATLRRHVVSIVNWDCGYWIDNNCYINEKETGKPLPLNGVLSDFMEQCGLSTDVLELRVVQRGFSFGSRA